MNDFSVEAGSWFIKEANTKSTGIHCVKTTFSSRNHIYLLLSSIFESINMKKMLTFKKKNVSNIRVDTLKLYVILLNKIN